MKKTGVVIGASQDAVHTIHKAKEIGVKVVAIDGNPNAAGFEHADEICVVDISSMEKAYEEVKRINPDFVIPVPVGRYLLTTGYVNEKCDLKGIKYAETNLSTDKFLFHKKLQEKDLRPVQAFLITKETVREELEIPYPAIMKPRFGSGSRDVFYIESDEDLEHAYNSVIKTEEDFVLEQAVQGTEYGVDGAVINGELQITIMRKKVNTPLPVRQVVSYFSVTDTKENETLINAIRGHLQDVVKALGYNDCLINADVIANGENVFVIEIAPRPSGYNLHNLFVPMATGIDMAEQYIRFMLGEDCCFEPNNIRCLQIRYFDFQDVVLKEIPTEEELRKSGKCNLLKWACNMQVGDYLDKVVNGRSIMGRGLFVIEGADERDLLQQSEWILSQFVLEER